jgi:YD repeat-containing protein
LASRGRIEWNAENQLIEVLENETTVATFEYDPLGRRVEKVAGATTTTFTYDGVDILREVAGAATIYYVHGPDIDEPLAKEVSATTTYYHADALGSILKITDSTGDVTHEYRYDPFGRIELGASQGGYSFTGREWDSEVGLHFYSIERGTSTHRRPVFYRRIRSDCMAVLTSTHTFETIP